MKVVVCLPFLHLTASLKVFHYYQPTLNLVQLVLVSDLPVFSWSSTEFELYPSSNPQLCIKSIALHVVLCA